jgi:cobalt-zinc-cadmium efflux system protein
MVTDAASFVVALIAAAVTTRPPSERATYGYARAEVLAAFVNALAMLALIVWIAVEAVQRLLEPVAVNGPTVMVGRCDRAARQPRRRVRPVARRERHQRAGRAAPRHRRSFGIGRRARRGRGRLLDGYTRMDPILSLLVALLILRSTLSLLKESTGVLLQGVPTNVSYVAVGRALAALPGVTGVHDLHVWHLSAERSRCRRTSH